MQQVTITTEMTDDEAYIGLNAALSQLDYLMRVDELLLEVYNDISKWQDIVDQLEA